MIIINGSSSALGKFLANHLAEAYGQLVIGVSRSPIKEEIDFKNYTELEILNVDRLDGGIGKATIVNVASAVPSGTTEPYDFYKANCLHIPSLIKKMARHFNAVNIVNISTSDVYAHDLPEAKENFTGLPSSDYGLSKLILEQSLAEFCELRRITCLNLRVPVLIVPGVKNNFIAKWFSLLESQQTDIQFSNPVGKFNNLGDARQILEIVISAFQGQVSYKFGEYNICSKNIIAVSSLLKIIENLYPNLTLNLMETVGKKQPQPMSSDRLSKICSKRYEVGETLEWYKGTLNG